MKGRQLLLFALLACMSLFVKPASASHLVGGSMGYEYLGPSIVVGGVQYYQYRITLVTYNNCDSTSNVPLPAAQQEIWLYEHDIPNNPMGGGDKVLFTTINVNLVDSNIVQPPTTSGCSIGGSVCIYRGYYEGLVDLPLSFVGYHAVFDDFARNGAIANLVNPGGTGMAFHSFIAPSLVDNSTPVFTDDPVPFLCVNDTVSILNTAIDPDGDLMIFSFVDPMAGINGFGPAPDPIPWPINIVNWDNGSGYDLTQPFGPAGYSFINGSTGLTQYMSPTTGNYVIAIEIREFRNGNLIGVSRRDLQLLVINCPPNDAPIMDPLNGTQTQFSVEEGDQLCFDVEFTDANGDSLTLDAQGQLFDINIINPNAIMPVPVVGDSTVMTQFCWNTACGQAQPLPYQFSVSVTDNGCPPKTTNVVYEITVNPFQGPQNINGPTILCENESVTYTTDTIAGATYTWTVTGGTITSGQGSPSIDVDWGVAGPGLVEVFATSPLGCPSQPIQVNITIVAPPLADAGLDTIICLGDTAALGGAPTGPPGATYSWTPAGSLDNATDPNPNAFPTTTTTYVVTVDIGLACATTDTVVVTVGSTVLDAGPDVDICPGDSAQLQASGAVTYSWTPTATLSDSLIADPWASPATTTVYTVTMTDAIGCIGVDSATVTVNPLPTVDPGPDTTICTNTSVVIGGTPTGPAGSTYAWTPNGTLDDGSLANPTATPTVSPTTYQVVVTDANGCIDSASVTVTLNTLPIADAGTDATICNGDSTQLNATGGGTYSWSPTTGLSDPLIADPWASPTITTTYTVTVTDINGCVDTDDVTITVDPLPAVDAGPDETICIGQSVTIGGSPTGPAGSTYVWTPNGTLDDGSLANPLATPSTTTTYTVVVTDGNGCVDTDSMMVTVNPLPIVDAGPDTAICDGNSVVIGGSPTGPAGSTYVWTPNGTLDDGSLANPTATPTATPTTYTVTVTDVNGCVNTDDMTVTLDPLPVADAGPDETICINDSVQLNGSGGGTYSWSPTTGLSDPLIADPWASPTVTTTYILTVTDGNGCQDMDTMTVTVNPLPIVDAGLDSTICDQDTIMIGGAPTGPAGSTFSWDPVTGLDDPSLANPMAFPSTTTTYVVTVTDVNTCVNTDTMTITVNPLPPADAGPDVTICDQDSTQLNASGGTSYSWDPVTDLSDPLIADPWASPSTTTQYVVTVTDGNNCSQTDTMIVNVNPLPVIDAGADETICIGDSVQLGATGGPAYSWNPPTDLSDPNIGDPWASPTDTTTYVLTVTDGNNCVSMDSMTVFVLDLPPADAGPDLWLCSGGSIQLNATGGTSYSWSPGADLDDPNIANPVSSALDTTIYIVTVTDAAGCVNTDTMTLFVNDDPPIDMGPGGAICLGDSIMIGGNPTSVPGSVYTWTPNGSLDDGSIPNPTAFPTATTMYYLTVVNDTCSSMDSVEVIVNTLPVVDAGADEQICIGDSVQLLATGGVSYSWMPTTALSDSLIPDPWASPIDTTMYTVTVTDANGCINFDSMTVIVNPLPNVDAGPDTAICINDSTQLMATGAATYSWSPGADLSDSLIADPWASNTITTTFYVVGVDSNSCVNNDSVTVSINSLPPADAGADVDFCIGDSAQLNASGGTSYVWTPGATLSDSLIADPWASPTGTTVYYVTVTDGNSCSDIDSVLVTINPLPNADAGQDLEICLGGQAHLLASGGETYSWSPPGDLDDPNVADPWANPTDTTTYIVTVTDSLGCVQTDTMVLTVNPLPPADAGAAVSICLDDTVQLNATGGVGYEWTPPVFISDPLVPDPFVYPDTTMWYYVTVTDTNNCDAMDSVLVSVFRVTAGPDTAICDGESVQLFSSGPNAVTFSWSPIAGLDDPSVANPVATPSTTTTYTVTITDNNGCVDQASVTISVNPAPTASFDTEFEGDCDGLRVMFTNTSSGADTYLWDFGDGNSSTEVDPEHLFPYSTDYNVLLTAYSSFGCPDTASFGSSVATFEDYFDLEIPNVISPNGDGVNDIFSINLPGYLGECVDLKIFNRWGQVMFQSSGYSINWDAYTSDGVKVNQGTYFFTLNVRGIEYKGSLSILY